MPQTMSEREVIYIRGNGLTPYKGYYDRNAISVLTVRTRTKDGVEIEKTQDDVYPSEADALIKIKAAKTKDGLYTYALGTSAISTVITGLTIIGESSNSDIKSMTLGASMVIIGGFIMNVAKHTGEARELASRQLKRLEEFSRIRPRV